MNITDEMAIAMVKKNTETALTKLRENWIVLIEPLYSRYDELLIGKIIYGYENEDFGHLLAMPIETLEEKFPSVSVIFDTEEQCLSISQKLGNFERLDSISIETEDELNELMDGHLLELVSKYTSP